MTEGLAHNLEEAIGICATYGSDEQDHAQGEGDTTTPEKAPSGTAIVIGTGPKDSKRFVIGGFGVLPHLACSKAEVEGSSNDGGTAKKCRTKQQSQRCSKAGP